MSFFRRPHADVATRLYGSLATQARLPGFYTGWGVPDTVDGRFDLLVLHAWLTIDRLEREPDGGAIGQALFDVMFGHLDLALREMGAQDLGVGRRIKIMAEGFHGRSTSYRAAWREGTVADRRRALARNVFAAAGAADPVLDAAVGYVDRAVGVLSATATVALLAAEIGWPAPSRAEGTTA